MATNMPPNNTVPISDQRLTRRIAGNFRLGLMKACAAPHRAEPLQKVEVSVAYPAPRSDLAAVRAIFLKLFLNSSGRPSNRFHACDDK
jgi:hypothetical protein